MFSRIFLPPISTSGNSRSSHGGSHQAFAPSNDITAGMMVIRTRKASKRTAADIANPIDFATVSGISMNAEKTEIMMTAAEVTTRAPWKSR